jgi:hypothetical protein
MHTPNTVASRRWAALTLLASCTLLLSCDSPPADDTGAVVRYTLGDGPLGYGDVPFPSDLYLDDDGRLSVGALPTRRSGDAFFVTLRDLLASRDGFCATCSLHVYFDGALDPNSVPPTMSPTASASDPIVLVDLDASPPHLFPLRVWYDPIEGHLAVRPVRGESLAPRHRFALALTSGLMAVDGTPVRASDDFAAIRDGVDGTHPTTVAALDGLDALGVDRDSIVSLTTFTTASVGGELARLRTALHAGPIGAIVVDRVYAAAALDDLFGAPSQDRPGLDVPPIDGIEGSRSVVHDAIGTVVLGRLSAPRVITGSGAELGTLLTDVDGAPAVGAPQDIPFALTIPAGAALEDLPVIFVHHGFSESSADALFVSNTAAHAGYATFSIDAFLHGGRAEDPTDESHDLRGSPGADGFLEGTADLTRLFALSGTPSGMSLSPSYLLGTFSQFAADAMSVVRFLRDGDLSPIASAADLTGLSFDRDHVAYAGVSMGTVVGASVLAGEPDIHASILFVPLGAIIDTLCDGAGFRPLAAAFANTLRVSSDFDEITRSCVGEPIFDLLRWGLEPIDPLALAPAFFDADAHPDGPPDVLWILASHDEAASPPAAQSMLGVAGVEGVGHFLSVPLLAASLPVSANHPSGATALAMSFEPASHGLPEYIVGSAHYALPLEPPFVPDAATFENPIVEVHDRVETFLRTSRESHARVE